MFYKEQSLSSIKKWIIIIMWLYTVHLVSSKSLETTRSQIDLKRLHLQEAKKISYCRFAQFHNLSLILWHNFEQKKRNWLSENKIHQAMVLLISSSFCDLFLINAHIANSVICRVQRSSLLFIHEIRTLLCPSLFHFPFSLFSNLSTRKWERGKGGGIYHFHKEMLLLHCPLLET